MKTSRPRAPKTSPATRLALARRAVLALEATLVRGDLGPAARAGLVASLAWADAEVARLADAAGRLRVGLSLG